MILFIALAAAAVQPSLRPVGELRTSVLVRYDDLVLATFEGRRKFDHRIARAASRICTPDAPSTEQAVYDIDGCVANVVAHSAQDQRRAIDRTNLKTRSAASD